MDTLTPTQAAQARALAAIDAGLTPGQRAALIGAVSRFRPGQRMRDYRLGIRRGAGISPAEAGRAYMLEAELQEDGRAQAQAVEAAARQVVDHA